MWGAEVSSGDMALMTVPVASFSDGSVTVEPSNYHRLPKPRADTFQNRFVGEYLVYGSGSGWGLPANQPHSLAFAVHWPDGIVYRLVLPHGTDRIEQLGSDAVLVGSDGSNLHFTSVRLGSFPEVVDDFVRRGASQSERRSQGFFYQAEGQDSGLLGLPISVPGRAGYRHLFDSSAAILFLRNDSLHFQETGELTAQPERANSDGCRASCVDWYGNARPLFVRGRVIALLGYELVEGTLDGGSIREIRRKSYAPQNLDTSKHPGEEKLQSLK
jgi:hypothetical protein